MDLIRLSVLPPATRRELIATLVIASPATRLVKSFAASPWEVFLCPERAHIAAIHYNKPQKQKPQPPHKPKGKR